MLHTLLYFLALFSLSTSANWAKLNQMPVEVLGFYRLAIAALLLALWLFAVKRVKIPRPTPQMWWIVLSGFFFFLHLWTFKYAAKNTSISNSMIIFSSNPVWASLGAVLFFHEKIHTRLVLSYLLALGGVYTLVAHGLNLNDSFNSGDLSAFGSAMLYALYMLTGKKARLHFNNKFYALIQYSVCALCFGLCVWYTGNDLVRYSNTSWLAVAGLVLLPTFFGHFTFTYLVEHMDLSLMTCGKLIEPIMASIIAAIVFRETLSPRAPVSFSLTALAILILFSPQLRLQFQKLRR